jgi:hypothetical protein
MEFPIVNTWDEKKQRGPISEQANTLNGMFHVGMMNSRLRKRLIVFD